VARQGTLDDKEIASIQAELDNAAKIQDEVVIAAVYPLETLLARRVISSKEAPGEGIYTPSPLGEGRGEGSRRLSS
jgi:hypothetical protein